MIEPCFLFVIGVEETLVGQEAGTRIGIWEREGF